MFSLNCCCNKIPWQKYLSGKGFILAQNSRIQFIIEFKERTWGCCHITSTGKNREKKTQLFLINSQVVSLQFNKQWVHLLLYVCSLIYFCLLHACWCLQGPEEVLNPLNLKLQTVVSCYIQVLGTQPVSYERT